MREVFVTTPTKPHHRALLEQAAAGRCRLTFGTDGIERADAVIGAVEPEMLRKIPAPCLVSPGVGGGGSGAGRHAAPRLPPE